MGKELAANYAVARQTFEEGDEALGYKISQLCFEGPEEKLKLTEITRRTALGKFRFGTPGYDRWAVIYGRVEARKGEDAKKAPANLVIRGASVILFLTTE